MRKVAIILAGILTIDSGHNFFAIASETETVRRESLRNPTIYSNDRIEWDCVYFGEYPQSDVSGKIKEPIKWRVLETTTDEMILMSDKNLDVVPFHSEYNTCNWESSYIRAWLNSTFYDCAFSEAEKAAIISTTIDNESNSKYKLEDFADTIDKIYLASEKEVNNMTYGFATEKSRVRKNTAYVAAGGSYEGRKPQVNQEGTADLWWLRTSGEDLYNSMFIEFDGTVNYEGYSVSSLNCVVCPVIRIDIASEMWKYAGTVDSNGIVEENVENESNSTSLEEITKQETTTVMEESTSKGAQNKEEVSSTKDETSKENISTTKEKTTKYTKIKTPKIKKATKKKKARIVEVAISKIKGAKKYEIHISTTKKFKKIIVKKNTKKIKLKIRNKKLAGKKQLYIRVRAFYMKKGKLKRGKWSAVKRIKQR